jgi:hypothetical protein
MNEGMTKEEAIEYFKSYRKIVCEDHLKICPKDSIAYQATLKEKEFYDMAIKALEQQDKILQILDDYELEAWEILEMIKEVVRV